METQVLGLSVDSVPCLQAWADSLGGISYPLLSDFYPHGETALRYGVLRSEGYSERAIFVIDKNGIIRSAKVYPIDEQPDNDELLQILQTLEPELAAQQIIPQEKPQPQDFSGVTLYCTPWCPECRRARAYLRKHQVTFKEVDIARDRAAAAQVREWTGGFETTPTFNINGTVLVTFSPTELDKVFGF